MHNFRNAVDISNALPDWMNIRVSKTVFSTLWFSASNPKKEGSGCWLLHEN